AFITYQSRLKDADSPIFSNTSYFGMWRTEFEALLRQAGNNSYLISLMRSTSGDEDFCLNYVKEGTLHSKLLRSPAVNAQLLDELNLSDGLTRPEIPFRDLVPFLV